ncbi:hypothetical protein D3C79_880990 [compost metagenome]
MVPGGLAVVFEVGAVIGGGLVDPVGGAALACLARQVQETAVTQAEALVARQLDGFALAAVQLAVTAFVVAAAAGALEDDVDHSGHRIRAVLGGGAVFQDFDV